MIRYRLQCKAGHEFEAWFKNGGAFDRQADRGEVVCPDCGSDNVTKAPMAPSVATGRKKEAAPAIAAAPREATKHAEAQRKILALMREMRAHVERTAEYVGPRFPEEARKMHFNEIETRSIYGEASLDEARQLAEDGVEFCPLPRLPDDQN
ncbi:MAG TPA: DUF1178 family protein [Hyphomicrobiaceae bacterium]|nr:DUF1178 family protein [Hyphomicrobiaceae bacterium]